ncbi:unnamed protein product [Rotaria magnacalcarata]|uniref:Protein SDA1 n=3 Tax=Rotaria magnacalcarata TaxID=392030 RepID=A0A820BMR1_9BILA|nr:unnamed protein product [Rotaria magnacalcarata]CAF4201149.1 unnamed protein product [Rotaria magnacalcarata]
MSANDRLTRSLPHLQNLIKRDSDAYREDFKLQYLHFESQFMELTAKPDTWNKSLAENISFVSQVAHCYPDECKGLSQMFIDVLRLYSTLLNNDVRLVIVRALILMRNRGLIDCIQLCELFFLRLLQCQDRLLRVTIQTHIINDIKKQNEKHKNNKLNSTLQNFMCTIIKESNAIAVKMALDIMVSLYRKNIWNDAKTANIIASTCFSKITKVQVAALNFFLCNNQNKDNEKDSDSDDDEKLTKKDILLGHRVGKKTSKRKKQTERALKALEKQKKKKKVEIFDYSALHLLYDAQDFAERLFRQLESSNERFEVKLLHQDFLSRLIGLHQLLLLNFYPYLQRYLQPHQRQVTKILLYVAQASHELVPPDILESICKTIANNFITERNSGEVMAVGLNTIREICSKSYLAMDQDLLIDLSKYKSYRDKSVSASARSLIQLFREKNPQLLERKDRGKPTEFQRDLVPLDYGQSKPKSYLEGAEIFQQDIDDQDEQSNDEDEQDDDQQSEEDWINVSNSDEDDELDDNDENQENGDKMETTLTEEERRERAITISSQRILTQQEFEQLKVLELKRRIQDRRRNRLEESMTDSRKRKTISIDTDSDSDDENKKNNADQNSGLITLRDIERVHKKRAHDKESRLETVIAGREGRAKFGKWKKEQGHAGTTNKEKLKNKNFQMLKPKLRNKQKRSFRDKQIALRDALLKDKRLR